MRNRGTKLGVFLLLVAQLFSVAHASEFGSAPHEHNGVACLATLTDEQEALVPSQALSSWPVIAQVSRQSLPAIHTPAQLKRSIRPPPTGPPSI